MRTFLAMFIFAAVSVSTSYSVTKRDSTIASTPGPGSIPLTANETMYVFKVYLQTGAKLIGVSEASVKKIIEIIDLELPGSVFAPLFNQVKGVIERISNRIFTAVTIEKTIPAADVDLILSKIRKVMNSMNGVFIKKS